MKRQGRGSVEWQAVAPACGGEGKGVRLKSALICRVRCFRDGSRLVSPPTKQC